MRCKVGEEVGYSIRFEDVTSAKTRIKYLTDGMLLREALVDPLLSRYSVVMIDEAHERSMNSDILLGLLKKIRKKRPELRIIVSSATLQAESLVSFFAEDGETNPGCRIVNLEGRAYPVDVLYLESPSDDYVQKAVETAFNIHIQEGDGDTSLRRSHNRCTDVCLRAGCGEHAQGHPIHKHCRSVCNYRRHRLRD